VLNSNAQSPENTVQLQVSTSGRCNMLSKEAVNGLVVLLLLHHAKGRVKQFIAA